MICLSTTTRTIEEAVQEALTVSSHIDAVELRADLLSADELSRPGLFPRLLADAGVPRAAILAIRRAVDGGDYAGKEGERARLLESAVGEAAAAGRPFFAVELEEDFDPPPVRGAAAAAGSEVIRSLYDLSGVPDGLEVRLRTMARSPKEIIKAAVTPRSTGELADLCELSLSLGQRRRILYGMGEWGVPSRVLAGRLGSMLSLCSMPGSMASHGDISPEDLDTLYRYRSVGAETALFCVIGNPVMHSRSPHYHNRRFAADGADALYFPVQVDDVSQFFRLCSLTGILGASVTIPHKGAVIPFLESRDEAVERVGACNTLLRRGGGWHGMNTDVPGFLKPLLSTLGRRDLRGLRAGVIGAGGAARGVVYALLSEGASVCVINRTRARAEELVQALAPACPEGATLTAGGLDEEGARLLASHRDVVVQTTSVGMHPREGEDPFPHYRFRGDETVCDIIYTPERTTFLERAAGAGCGILTGRAMFDEQAAQQYREFRSLV